MPDRAGPSGRGTCAARRGRPGRRVASTAAAAAARGGHRLPGPELLAEPQAPGGARDRGAAPPRLVAPVADPVTGRGAADGRRSRPVVRAPVPPPALGRPAA